MRISERIMYATVPLTTVVRTLQRPRDPTRRRPPMQRSLTTDQRPHRPDEIAARPERSSPDHSQRQPRERPVTGKSNSARTVRSSNARRNVIHERTASAIARQAILTRSRSGSIPASQARCESPAASTVALGRASQAAIASRVRGSLLVRGDADRCHASALEHRQADTDADRHRHDHVDLVAVREVAEAEHQRRVAEAPEQCAIEITSRAVRSGGAALGQRARAWPARRRAPRREARRQGVLEEERDGPVRIRRRDEASAAPVALARIPATRSKQHTVAAMPASTAGAARPQRYHATLFQALRAPPSRSCRAAMTERPHGGDRQRRRLRRRSPRPRPAPPGADSQRRSESTSAARRRAGGRASRGLRGSRAGSRTRRSQSNASTTIASSSAGGVATRRSRSQTTISESAAAHRGEEPRSEDVHAEQLERDVADRLEDRRQHRDASSNPWTRRGRTAPSSRACVTQRPSSVT